MFFYETFGTVGVPEPLLVFLQKHFADKYFGKGFSNFGFVPNPDSQEGIPLGLAPTTGKIGNVTTQAFTCASCHFGKMPDGRYAVGYGNLPLDYGRLMVSLGAPISLSLNENDPKVHPDVRAALKGPIAEAKKNPLYLLEVAQLGLQLISALNEGIDLSIEEQERFLKLRTGTMDFLTEPLIEDGVWTVSRLIPLWNIPTKEMRQKAGMKHDLLSWAGGAHTVKDFIRGFVMIGAADAGQWDDHAILPLEAYIRSLRTPPLQTALDAEKGHRGAQTFVTAGCLSCHVGASGEVNRAFTFEEIGTDDALKDIFSPKDGKPCCGLDAGGEFDITRGVKAGRLVGIENQFRFLHNGAVGSLEQLFCLAPRDPAQDLGQKSDGHWMTCDGLDEAQKRDLIEYLKSL